MLLFVAVILVVTFFAGLVVIQIPGFVALSVGLGLAMFVLAFFNLDLALFLLIFAMLLSPEFSVGGGGGTSMETQRGAVIRLDDLLLVLISFSWLARMALQKDLGLILRTPLNRPIIAYTFVFVLSTGLGMMVGRVQIFSGFFFILKYLEYFVLYFMVSNSLRTKSQAYRYIAALLITAGIVSVIAIVQIPGGRRVSAPFEGERGEPNTLGGYLVLMIALSLSMALTIRDRAKTWLLVGLSFIMVIPVLFSLSRSSWLAMFPMTAVLLFFCKRRGYLLLGVIVIALLAQSVIPPEVRNRILYTFQQQRTSVAVGGVALDPSTSARLSSYWSVLTDVTKHPILGYGVTGYPFLDTQLMKVLADTGLAGVGTFLWLIAALFYHIWSSLKRATTPLEEGIALGFLAGLAAMLTHSLGSNTFIIVRIMEPFWFLAAIVTLLPSLEEKAAVEPSVPAPRRLQRRPLPLPTRLTPRPVGRAVAPEPPAPSEQPAERAPEPRSRRPAGRQPARPSPPAPKPGRGVRISGAVAARRGGSASAPGEPKDTRQGSGGSAGRSRRSG
ncbi:MAG: O-antigen ligase family protein [Candidatus Tectomicrobia bacterium]|nr:O-antigen ligase family protein [Candidatus Tectomicrobia bacterium]